jgi:hypothetical protein
VGVPIAALHVAFKRHHHGKPSFIGKILVPIYKVFAAECRFDNS